MTPYKDDDGQMVYMTKGDLNKMLRQALDEALEEKFKKLKEEMRADIQLSFREVGLGDPKAKSDITGIRRFWRAKERITSKMVDTIAVGIARLILWSVGAGVVFFIYKVSQNIGVPLK